MSIIDERIVSMVFDNSKFQQNVSQTQDSLDALDASIEEYTRNSSDNFLNLSDGLSRMDIVFSGFYQKIGGYLADLTMKGVQFSKSLSIDQVSAGFSKYTAETLAVQTIVSNTNNTLEDTYDILGDILDYTDKTSYHYDTMTNTISKFANQGVALDEAAQAVKGIANWAAISGAGIEKADIAMNSLIRAFSKGTVTSREWMTISQSANMGTANFKQTVIETAQALAKEGKASKKWLKITAENWDDEKNGVFGNNKLLTKDVMLAVLQKYGDETSELGKKALAAASEAKTFGEAIGAVKDAVSTGFGTSFRYLFGNYDEARKFWTDIQDMMLEVFTIGIEYRNEVLRMWHESDIGGYKDMVEGIKNTWEAIKNLVKPIGDAFQNVFKLNSITKGVEALTSLTTKFKDWSENIKKTTSLFGNNGVLSIDKKDLQPYEELSDRKLPEIYNVIKNIFTFVKEAKDGVMSFVKNLTPAFGGVGSALKGIIGFISKVTGFVTTLIKSANQVNFFGRIAKSVATIFNSLLRPALDLVKGILEKLGFHFGEASKNGETFRAVFDKIATIFEKISTFLTEKAIGPAVEFLSGAFKKLGKALEPVGEKLQKVKDAISNFFTGKKNIDPNEKSGFAKFIEGLGKALDYAWQIIKTIGTKVFDWCKEFVSTLTGGGGLSALLGGAGLAGIGIAIKRIAEAFAAGGELYDILYSFEKANNMKALKEFATAMLMLAAALLIVASIDSNKLGKSFLALAGMVEILSLVLDQLRDLNIDAIQARSLKKLGVVLIELAASVLILAIALKTIASIDSTKLFSSFVVLEALLASMVGAAVLLTKYSKSMEKGALYLVELALAVRILASSVKSLADLSWEELAKGLIGTITLLGAVAAAAILMKDTGIKASTGLAIIEIAAALKILVGVVRDLGEMEWDVLKQGLLSVIVALGGIGLVLELFPKDGMMSIGLGLIMVAAALKIITGVVNTLGNMDFVKLGVGIGSMAASLALIGLTLKLFKGNISGAAALLVVSAALVIFAGAIKLIAGIPFEELAIGMGVLVVGLAALGGMMALLSGFAPGMLLVAASFAVLGVAVAALGAGLLAISAGGAGAVGALYLLVRAVGDLIPFVLKKLGEGIVEFLMAIAKSGAALLEALALIIVAICDALIQAIPKIVEVITVLIMALIDAVIELIPKIVELGVTLILSLLDGIAKSVPAIIDTAVTIVIAFIEGIGKMVVAIVQAGIDMAVAIMNGIADAINDPNNKKNLKEAGMNLLNAVFGGFIQKLKDLWPQIKEKGQEFIQKFKEGFDEKIQIIKEWFQGLPGKIKQWFIDLWNDIKGCGEKLVSGLKEGISDAWNNLGIVKWFKKKIGGLTSAANDELGIHSPSRVFAEIGRYIDEGLIVGIDAYASKVNKATENMASGAVDTMEDSLRAIGDINLNEMSDPVIRPVLDLSEIQNGSKDITKMLSNDYSIGLSASSGMNNASNNPENEIYAPTINMTINGAQGQDVRELADIVSRKINQTLISRERVWA